MNFMLFVYIQEIVHNRIMSDSPDTANLSFSFMNLGTGLSRQKLLSAAGQSCQCLQVEGSLAGHGDQNWLLAGGLASHHPNPRRCTSWRECDLA